MQTTLKLIALLRPDSDVLSWQNWAASGDARLPGLKRLVFNTVLPTDVRQQRDLRQPFAGVIEAWLDDRDAADALAERIRERGVAAQLFVNELLIHDSGIRPLPSKILVTLRRRADLTRAQAQRHWRTQHVEIGLIEHNATDFLRLYIQNHVIDTDQPAGSPYDFDGMPEYWVDEADLAAVGAESAVMRAIADDETLFLDTTGIVTLLLQERELFVADGVAGWPVRDSPLHDVLRMDQTA